MKSRVLCALVLLASVGRAPMALADPAPVAPAEMVVSVDWLRANLSDKKLVILHVGPRAEFEKEHIAGAQLVLPADLSIPAADSPLRLEMLSGEALRLKLQAIGISDDSRIVICFGADWVSPATRVYFSLDAAGLGRNTSMLDGGLNAWKAAGGAVTMKIQERQPGRITAAAKPELVATLEDLQTNLVEKRASVIDARLKEFFSGASAGTNMPRAGHIPGASSMPFTSLVEENGKFKSLGATATLFQDAGVPPGGTVLSYCHIGQQATVVYFAAKRLGLKARVYDGSWDEWSRHSELPVEPASAPATSPTPAK